MAEERRSWHEGEEGKNKEAGWKGDKNAPGRALIGLYLPARSYLLTTRQI